MDFTGYTKQKLIETILHFKQKTEKLEFEIAQLKRAVFGSKSERFVPEQNPQQAELFESVSYEQVIEAPSVVEEKIVKKEKRKGKKPIRKKIPTHLRREQSIIEPDVDTSEMTKIGEQISEKMEINPASIYVRRIVRPKYIDKQGQIHIAPLADPFPKSSTGPSLAAHISVQKFVDHLPNYRQSTIYKRQEIDLPRSTLNGIIARGATLISPLYEALNNALMNSDYIQADESSIPVLTRDKPGSTLKGCMLAKVAAKEKLVVFDYIKTKEKSNTLKSLNGFSGHLQVDGNVSYESLGKKNDIELMHCLVHSRRKFENALEYNRIKSSYVLAEIQKIYRIERQVLEEKLNIDQIKKRRIEQALPILENLKIWLLENYDPNLPINAFTQAVRYMLKRWEGLIKYTSHGYLRPDNNLIENQIRPLALGRKNYLFAGSHKGALYAAIFYSLFATCKINNIDPQKWLCDVYKRIADHKINKIQELLPTDKYIFLD